MSSHSFFYALDADHIEEKVSHRLGLLVLLVLETIVKFLITVTVRLGVEIKVKHPVLGSERFDLRTRRRINSGSINVFSAYLDGTVIVGPTTPV